MCQCVVSFISALADSKLIVINEGIFPVCFFSTSLNIVRWRGGGLTKMRDAG